MKTKNILPILAFVLLLASCIPSQQQVDSAPAPSVDEIVQATLQALTAQAAPVQATATETPVPADNSQPAQTGSIAGAVMDGYRHVVAFRLNTDEMYAVHLDVNSRNVFLIENLPAGIYHVLAFTDFMFMAAPAAGSYSNYVKCGLLENCKDHTLLNVTVEAGKTTGGVYIFDGWGTDALTPYYDKYLNSKPEGFATQTPAPEIPQTGKINGELSYKEGKTPAMIVAAYPVGGDPRDYYFSLSQGNMPYYQIAYLPPGKYYVYAYTLEGDLGNGTFYPDKVPAGYTQFVVCGMLDTCTDHTPIEVEVKAGESATVNPMDWGVQAAPPFPLP